MAELSSTNVYGDLKVTNSIIGKAMTITGATGSAILNIIADPSNNSSGEGWNPYLFLSQDGGIVTGMVGLTGGNNLGPNSTAISGAIDNHMLVGTDFTSGGLQFYVGTAVRATINSSGIMSFTQSPTAPTPNTNSNDTTLATTAWVKGQNYATSISETDPVFVGWRDTSRTARHVYMAPTANGIAAFRAFTVSDISASGSPSASTYLRGDGSWATISAGGSGTVTTVSASGTQGVTTSVTNSTSTPDITIGLGAITPTSITTTGIIEVNRSGAFNTTIPGNNKYNIHFPNISTADHAQGITWSGHNDNNVQAGIYVQNSGAYGTKMYFATTNSYAAFSQTRMMIDHTGLVGIGLVSPTARLHVRGTTTSTGIAFRIENSAFTELLRVTDSGALTTYFDAVINSVNIGRGGGNNTSNIAVGVGALTANTGGWYNTAIGTNTLAANLTQHYSTAIGYHTLRKSTAGANTAFGALAAENTTSGGAITAVGYAALMANTTGANNTAIGASALSSSTTGTNNTAIGSGALQSLTISSNNTAVGASALVSATTGTNNTAIGASSLLFLTTGSGNTSIGRDAGYSITNGPNNTAIGHNALRLTTTGDANVAIGSSSLYSNTTGLFSVAIGNNALFNSTGSSNTGVGTSSGLEITSGTNNTLLGHNSGRSLTTGSNNTIIGANVTVAATLANTIILADGAGAQRLFINSSGNVGIGNTAPASTVHIGTTSLGTYTGLAIGYAANSDIRVGQSSTNNLIFAWKYNATTSSAYGLIEAFGGNNHILMQSGTNGNVGIGMSTLPTQRLHVTGNILATGTVTGSNAVATSDIRLKENIRDLERLSDEFDRIRPVRYIRKSSGKEEIGFIAQELRDEVPEFVVGDETKEMLAVNYAQMVALLIKEVQELKKEIKELKQK
jgi:hypothetical protein